MKFRALKKKISKLEEKLVHQQQKLAELKHRLPLVEVIDYELSGPTGAVKLSALFNGKKDLIVVHNMGTTCRYCTMWADGFNGLVSHLSNRAGFAIVSPDAPKTQQAFAQKRGWKFPMYSGRGSSFIEDMGFKSEDGWMPGVSTFVRKGKKIYRVASAPFGPFDSFCATWPLFALLAGGADNWEPQYRY